MNQFLEANAIFQLTLDLGKEQQAFVKFKDYGFFVPMNAQNREVVVEGKAFIEGPDLRSPQKGEHLSRSGEKSLDIDLI